MNTWKSIGFALIAGSILSACNKHNESNPTLNIDYQAAYIVNGESNTISVIDISTSEVKGDIKLGEASTGSHGGHGGTTTGILWPHHLSINPANTQLAIGVPGMDLSEGHAGGAMAGAGKIVVADARTGGIMHTLELPVMNHNAAFSPDGKEIWTTQMEEAGKVLVYDAQTYTLKNTIAVGKQPAEITFSHDGLYAFIANGGSNTVTAIKVADKSVVASFPTDADPVGAWPGKDNKMYVDNEAGQTVTVIDVNSLAVTETVPLGFMPGMAAYNLSLNELWVTDAENGKVVWFGRAGNAWVQQGSLVTGPGAHGIAFTADEKVAYVTNQMAESVTVINAETKQKVKDIAVGKKPNGVVLKQ
jgi:YVTN family beta-propeller protein